MSYLKAVLASFDKKAVLTPFLTEFLEAEERKQRLIEDYRRKGDQKDALLTIRAMRARYAERNEKEPAGFLFHPSALGTCQRLLWFKHFGAPTDLRTKDNALQQYLVFEFGTYLHLIIQNLCERAGILVAREGLVFSREQEIIGHYDGIVRLHKQDYLLEIKSINSNQWPKVQNQPKPEHVQQAHAYMLVKGLKWAIIIYVNKDRAMVKEHVVAFNPATCEVGVRQRIATYKKHLLKKTVPEREGLSPRQFPCSFCPYPTLCFVPAKVKAFQRSIQKAK